MISTKNIVKFDSDRERLGSELMVCFNYFENLHKVEKAEEQADERLEEQEIALPEPKSALDEIIDSENFIETKTFYNMRSKALNSPSYKEEKRKNIVSNILFVIDFLFTLMPGLLILAGLGMFFAYLYFNDASLKNILTYLLIGDGVLFVLLVLILAVRAGLSNRNFLEDILDRLFLIGKFRQTNLTNQDVLDYCVKNKDELKNVLNECDHDLLQEKERSANERSERRGAIIREYVRKADAASDALEYFSGPLKEKIKSSLKYVPYHYFNDEDITGLVFLYVNRRGDTIKELINVYENEKFKAKLLAAIEKNTQEIENLNLSVSRRMSEFTEAITSLSGSINSLSDNFKAIYQQEAKSLELYQEPRQRYEDLMVNINGIPSSVKIYG